MPSKGKLMSLESRSKLSKSCKGRIPWNKGLTKEDPRVMKNISGGSRKTQFKSGKRPEIIGDKNPNWKGGILIHQGYKYIRDINHPLNKNGYVQEHRLIIENKLGRILKPNEIVHHINNNTLDNRLENLMLMSQSEHIKLHLHN